MHVSFIKIIRKKTLIITWFVKTFLRWNVFERQTPKILGARIDRLIIYVHRLSVRLYVSMSLRYVRWAPIATQSKCLYKESYIYLFLAFHPPLRTCSLERLLRLETPYLLWSDTSICFYSSKRPLLKNNKRFECTRENLSKKRITINMMNYKASKYFILKQCSCSGCCRPSTPGTNSQIHELNIWRGGYPLGKET